MRAIVTREFEAAGMLQRADIAKLNVSLRTDLKTKGINIVEVDREAFRNALRKTSFYNDWKTKYGNEGWSLLEKNVGKLV
jgi:TRAP-type C4-dicarboxylate transport system substrate-binding protein